MEGRHKALELVSEDGWAFSLTSACTTIGRSRDNTLVVPNQYVSRRHAELRFDGWQYGIMDLGSQHGSALNGQQLQPHQFYIVHPGDVVALASQVSLAVRENVSQRPPAAWIQRPAGIDISHLAIGLRQHSAQVDLVLAGVGAFIVLLAFFVPWFRSSSPFADVFFGLGDSIKFDMSGMRLLSGLPELGVPGSPGVLLIPCFAIGALAISVLRRSNASMATRVWAIIQLALAFLGTACMFLLLILSRAQLEALFREAGLPGVTAEAFLKIQPATGFWLTCLGFILILGSGLWGWRGIEP